MSVAAKLRVGVIGFGRSARVFHCPLIVVNPHLELASVVERHSADSEKRYPGTVVRRSAREMAEDSRSPAAERGAGVPPPEDR